MAAFSCSTNFNSSPLPSQISAFAASDCPSQSLEEYGGFGRVDWFKGWVEVPVLDGNVSGFRVVELDPVYSLPYNTDLNFRFSGDTRSRLELVLELQDSNGNCLLEKPVYTSNNRSRHPNDTSFEPVVERFSTRVANPPDYASYAIRVGDRELVAVQLSEHAPTVAIPDVQEGQIFEQDQQVSVSWVGHDQDGDKLTYKVFRSYDAGQSWDERTITDNEGTKWDFLEFKTDEDARVAVVVSDGTRSALAVTPVFQVAERDPKVKIVSPVSGTTYYGQQKIQFASTDNNPNWDRGSHYASEWNVWSSSIDGYLGAGWFVNVSAEQLTPGDHIITVAVTDIVTGRTGTDSIPITIHEARQDIEPDFTDWFSGAVAVPLSSDETSIFELEGLAPVYSLPKIISVSARGFGWWDLGFTLELRDSTGSVIRSTPFYITSTATIVDPILRFGESILYQESFKFGIPDPPDYTSFAIKAGNTELAVIERSEHAPTVIIEGISENQVFELDDPISISWQGHDQDGDTLTYRIFISHDAGQTWELEKIFSSTDETQWNNFEFHATDEARIAVAASDRARSTFAMTPVFQVKP